ncbi:PHP domain-containing protein [Chloroflexota bacterium]
MLKADLHIHTLYSPECTTTLESITSLCLARGINCIAVADHNCIAGAVEMKRLAPFTVIVAEEIMTTRGEIMGMFLKEEVPKGLPPKEAAARVKVQGGLVCIPHPFDQLRTRSAIRRNLDELLPYIDIIEVFNARSLRGRNNQRALEFAQRHGLPSSAGSDSHTRGEIGNAYVEMPEFEDPQGFLQALREGKVYGRLAGPGVHFLSTMARLSNYFKNPVGGANRGEHPSS